MKILIIKTSALGDLIHTFPVVGYLRTHYPDAHIDWVVEAHCAELIEAHPQVDGVLKIESKKWRGAPLRFRKEMQVFRDTLRQTNYDVAFDLQGNMKSGIVLGQTRAQNKVGFGWKTVPEWPNVLFTTQKINPSRGKNIREDYLAVVQSYFKDSKIFSIESVSLDINASETVYVNSVPVGATLVCPGATWPNKQLAMDQLKAFLELLDDGPYLFAWGTQNEYEIASHLAAYFPNSVVLERRSLPVLQHVMAKCKQVIAMDSLPLHLCATTATPTISFFGPSSAHKYGPIGEKHKTIQGKCPYNRTFENRCPKLRTCRSGGCLKWLPINHKIIEKSR